MQDPFVLVQTRENLLGILLARLPYSANVYNLAKMGQQGRFSGDLKFYSLFGRINEQAWIVSTFTREDYGVDLNISEPGEWTEEVEEAFATTKIINWGNSYCFASINRRISSQLSQLIKVRIGNQVAVSPCLFYYMERTQARHLTIPTDLGHGVQIEPLKGAIGVDFLTNNFAYTVQGTRELITKLLDQNESRGVYIQGVPVSGVILASNGFIGYLFTLEKHRNKGYGTTCTKELLKSLAINGFIPCSCVETRNLGSRALHEKGLGMVVSHEVDYVIYQKPKITDNLKI